MTGVAGSINPGEVFFIASHKLIGMNSIYDQRVPGWPSSVRVTDKRAAECMVALAKCGGVRCVGPAIHCRRSLKLQHVRVLLKLLNNSASCAKPKEKDKKARPSSEALW